MRRAAVGASQYCVKTPDGIEAVLFGIRAAREQRNCWNLQLDFANAFNEVSRQRIWQQLTTDPALAPLLPFYRLKLLFQLNFGTGYQGTGTSRRGTPRRL